MTEKITCFLNISFITKNSDFNIIFEKSKEEKSTLVKIRITENNEPITIKKAKNRGFSFSIIKNKSGYDQDKKFISLSPNIENLKIFHNDKTIYKNDHINFFIKESIKGDLIQTNLTPD